MRIIIFAMVIIMYVLPGQELPDSTKIPTLCEEEYFIAKESEPGYPLYAQILYGESYWMQGEYVKCLSLQVYGNGDILLKEQETQGADSDYKFYLANNEELLESMAEDIVDLGLFESISGKTCSIFPGAIFNSHYLSLRIGEEYYSIATCVYDGEDPEWLTLVEYTRSIIEEYMIEENVIAVDEYLEIRDEIVEIYGYHALCRDESVRRYAEQIESEKKE